MSKRLMKERLMIQFWKSVFQPNVSLYPLMRLLLPQLDSERSTYGLRESSLGDVYIAALGLSKTLDQAMRLKSYKSPHRAAGGAAAGAHTSVGSVSGDFTLVLVDVLRKYISVPENSSKLTVADVNAMLDSLAQDRERGSAARPAIFTRAVTEMSPSENMWSVAHCAHSRSTHFHSVARFALIACLSPFLALCCTQVLSHHPEGPEDGHEARVDAEAVRL